MLKDVYTYIKDADADLTVIPVAADGTGSKWLDKVCEFWPELRQNYEAAFKTGKLHTGHILLTYSGLFDGKKVAFAVTRTSSEMTCRELTVRNILKALQEYCRENDIKTVAMTRIGAKEGLSWEHWIRRQYVRALEYEMGTEYKIYLY